MVIKRSVWQEQKFTFYLWIVRKTTITSSYTRSHVPLRYHCQLLILILISLRSYFIFVRFYEATIFSNCLSRFPSILPNTNLNKPMSCLSTCMPHCSVPAPNFSLSYWNKTKFPLPSLYPVSSYVTIWSLSVEACHIHQGDIFQNNRPAER